VRDGDLLCSEAEHWINFIRVISLSTPFSKYRIMFLSFLISDILLNFKVARLLILRIVCCLNIIGYLLLVLVVFKNFRAPVEIGLSVVLLVIFFFCRLQYLKRYLLID
jgi:hypothetical protein